MANLTCNQCLCMPSSTSLILNCLPNNTCQLFSSFPRTYQLQKLINARLYFPQGILPNASQCCMSNLTYLLDKLQSATPIYGQILNPRCLVIDNHGYVVTVSSTNNLIVRFNSTNMASVSRTSGSYTTPRTIRYYNENYYVGLPDYILVIDSNSLTIQNNMTSTNLSETRDMMFINNGDTLVVASTGNSYFLFFNRSSNVSTTYDLVYGQSVSYPNPHGFFFINDSYFYATSWYNNTIYSYSSKNGSGGWNENLFLNATPWAPESDGNHIMIDECGRFWFSLGKYGLQIFDNHGSFLANFTLTNATIFDTIMTDNYVMYLSDTLSNRIIRIDPDIECPYSNRSKTVFKYRQSVILLVSIITILAIIAIGTGLSPLYWPLPKHLPTENNSTTTNSSKLQTKMTTRLIVEPKKYSQITTVKLITALPITTNMVPVNVTIT